MSEGQGEVTAGQLLRQAREAAGLHVAALAVALKVPVRKLEALEEDRLDLLPDAVFVRALASSVCRTLKIDPQPVLDRLPQTAAPRLIQDHDGINTPFRAPSDGAGPSWFDQLSKPVYLAVFALLLAALVVILLPATQGDETAAAKSDMIAAPVPVVIPAAPVEPPAPAAAPAEPAPAAAVASPAPAVPAAPAVQAKAAPVEKSPAAAAVPPAPVAAAAPAPAVPAAGGLVVFRTKGPSWVEVTDAKGVVTLRRLLSAGETAGASGALPLAVTVGSANSTEVQVRGQAYDLTPVSRDNVARFEVR
jgi:cytoskeleton protein RodZ